MEIIDYVDPAVYLNWLAKEIPGFVGVFQQLAEKPLSLIVYNDAATLGNMMEVDQKKKTEVLS